jgi:succinate-semialdehyde dehydrogenase/glutarate-semialdehyde dehydrogenase
MRWRKESFANRAAVLLKAADIMESERQQLGELMTLEMGKPVRAAREEAAKCALALRYYAEHGEHFISRREVFAESGERAAITYQPLGLILAIMPWNFPFWQVVRFAAPALAAGNASVLKHASNVPQCALAIEDVFLRAGLPEGVFQTFLLPSSRMDKLIADDRIAAVTLTGSEAAGRHVASVAGMHLKKTVLELGGSDPFIVLESADIARTAAEAARARTVNSGQSCIAAKRFIVVEKVAREFAAAFTREMAALRVGDPLHENTDIGPLATEQVLNDVERQVDESVKLGAQITTGGTRITGPGHFYAPTVLVDVPSEAPVCNEEVFGPVAPVLAVANNDAALSLANSSRFGLGGSVWTRDEKEAEYFVNELACGMVFVNAAVHSDPRLPFGGIKRSGYGRELSEPGMHEFVNIRTVRVRGEPAGG